MRLVLEDKKSRRLRKLGIVFAVLLVLSIGLIGLNYFCTASWCKLLPISLRPIVGPPPQDITKLIPPTEETEKQKNGETETSSQQTGMPLMLPSGFMISIFAKDLPGARAMRFDAEGNLWVSLTGEGKIVMLEIENGRVMKQAEKLKNLNKPHGLVFDPADPSVLYIAETDNVFKTSIGNLSKREKILDLPAGGGHDSRTIGFGPDGKLYSAAGSSCNVCYESDERRAAILQYDPKTEKSKIYARGLRNAVFFIWDASGALWATEMGRDLLGDDTPPDEINIIKEGGNYGWPTCYGKNIHDADFDKNVYIRNPCEEPFETPSFIDIPAHSAPLGLAFIPKSASWPEDYRGDLLVSYHGSWNRSVPTGYKVVRHKFVDSTSSPQAKNGNYEGVENFIDGWLTPSGALGRPVDIVFGSDESMYLSDDKAGVIYKIEFRD